MTIYAPPVPGRAAAIARGQQKARGVVAAVVVPDAPHPEDPLKREPAICLLRVDRNGDRYAWAFGLSRAHELVRQGTEVDGEAVTRIAGDACEAIYPGGHTKQDVHHVADLLLGKASELLAQKPKVRTRAETDRAIEKAEAVVQVNGETLLDAR